VASAPRFDTEDVFDADYLYFYAGIVTDEISDRQTDTLWQLLELEAGMEVLDLACGHGRIANRLAAKGALVEIDYVQGDMRELHWQERFDAVASVFTSFGYFDDDDDLRVLQQVHKALKPGGRFGLELNNLPWLFANFREQQVTERDGDWMIDRTRYEPVTGRTVTQRTIIRAGQQRTFEFSVRVFTFTELRDWLVAGGLPRGCRLLRPRGGAHGGRPAHAAHRAGIGRFEDQRGFERLLSRGLHHRRRRGARVAAAGQHETRWFTMWMLVTRGWALSRYPALDGAVVASDFGGCDVRAGRLASCAQRA
jgi:SAM-dependent methyltransferase